MKWKILQVTESVNVWRTSLPSYHTTMWRPLTRILSLFCSVNRQSRGFIVIEFFLRTTWHFQWSLCSEVQRKLYTCLPWHLGRRLLHYEMIYLSMFWEMKRRNHPRHTEYTPSWPIFLLHSSAELKVKQSVDELSCTVHLCRQRCHTDTTRVGDSWYSRCL